MITKESIIQKTYCSENLPQPLFTLRASFRLGEHSSSERGPLGPAAKEGKFLPFVKGGKEGFSLQGLHYFGLTDKFWIPS
jgi:hypothetical protein